jgi:hypothetical protein
MTVKHLIPQLNTSDMCPAPREQFAAWTLGSALFSVRLFVEDCA